MIIKQLTEQEVFDHYMLVLYWQWAYGIRRRTQRNISFDTFGRIGNDAKVLGREQMKKLYKDVALQELVRTHLFCTPVSFKKGKLSNPAGKLLILRTSLELDQVNGRKLLCDTKLELTKAGAAYARALEERMGSALQLARGGIMYIHAKQAEEFTKLDESERKRIMHEYREGVKKRVQEAE